MRLEISILRNIRKTFFGKKSKPFYFSSSERSLLKCKKIFFGKNMRHFSRVSFLNFQAQNVPSWNVKSFLCLGQESSISQNIRKTFLLEKYKKVFNLGTRKFQFPKYKSLFKKCLKSGFFIYFIFQACAEKWSR